MPFNPPFYSLTSKKYHASCAVTVTVTVTGAVVRGRGRDRYRGRGRGRVDRACDTDPSSYLTPPHPQKAWMRPYGLQRFRPYGARLGLFHCFVLYFRLFWS